MKPEWSWHRSQRVVFDYLATLLMVAGAAIITAQLRHVFPALPNSLFFCAVILSAWRGGLGPGLLASVFSSAMIIFWLPPPSLTGPNAGSEVPRFLVFLFASLFISWSCNQQRRAQAALQQARDELEQRVIERTKDLTTANEVLRIEIGERKRTEALLDGQKRVLEMIAADAPLPESLAALIHLIEAHAPGMLGSILLIDEQGVHLCHGAAPSLPPEYTAAIDGVAISPNCGSCGTAAYRKEAVIVGDIATDQLWKDYRALALPHGLRACWSTPIFDAKQRLLGTFAMYYRQPALPQPEHRRLIEMATHVAAIAICRHHSQAELRESEAKLKEAQRLANMGYWERDLIADRITWSEDTYRIWGQQQRPDGFSQAELQKMIHPDDRELQRRVLAEAVAGTRRYDLELRIVRPDGEVRFVHVTDEIVCDESGRPVRMFGTVQDITERKQAVARLLAQEREIKAIVENSPDPIARFDREFRRTYVNPAFIKINRVPKESLLGRRVGSAVEDGAVNATGEEIEILHQSLKRVFDTGRPLGFETTWPWPTGRRSFAVHLEPEFDARGVLTSVLSIARDITEHKRAEEAVRESQQLLRLVLATLPVGVAVTDRAGNIVLDNEAAKRIWGKAVVSGSERWAQSKGFWHGSGERITPENWASVRALSKGQTSLNELIDIESYDGQKKIIQNSSAPIRNAEGSIVGALIVNEDVTERVRAEEALRDSYAQLRALSARLQSVREEEATRIAREIHDDLGQQLTGLKMDLVRAERKLEKLESSPTVNALLDTIVNATELADSMIIRVQEIASNLRPDMLDKLGLSAALHYESRRFQERTGVSCEARLPETELNLPAEVSTTLFRIFQECLTNVARHARATKVEVELKQEEGWLTLRVEDNGRGITEAEIANTESLGLLGMKERTALLGGEIVFYGEAEGGTIVNVSIPLNRTFIQAKVRA